MVAGSSVTVLFPDRPVGTSNTVETVADLRALDSTDLNEDVNVLVPGVGFYVWAGDSTATDDSTTVIKPSDKTFLQAGRWLIAEIGITGAQAAIDAAQDSADEASGHASSAAASATTALTEASAAAASAAAAALDAGEAALTSLASGYYPVATANVPRGATGNGAITGGSGGTNGDFALAFTGGNFAVNPSGTFTVAGGAVTAITLTGPGLYIGASPTAPTLDFSASSGLTGASAALTVGFLVGSGAFYWTDHASDTSLAALYQNVSGTATATSPLVTLPKIKMMPVVDSSVGGTANAITMTPASGFAVVGTGTAQEFQGIAAADNSGAVTVQIAGVFAGAATAVVMPNGDALPGNIIKNGYPFNVRPAAGLAKYVLTHPTQPMQSTVLLNQSGGTGNAIIGTVAHGGSRIRGDLTDTLFSVQVTASKAVGSASLELRKPDGSVIIAATPLRDVDQVNSPPTDAWLTGETILIRRHASGYFYLVKQPDRTTTQLALLNSKLIETGELVSSERPVSLSRMTRKMWPCDLYLHSSHYQDSIRRMQSDRARFVLGDMGEFQQISQNMCLNSIMAHVDGQWVQLANFIFDRVVGGIVTNNGLSPSTFEPVMAIGIFGEIVNPTNYSLAGKGHGHEESIALSMIGTTNDASTSNLPVDSAELKASPIGVVFEGDKMTVVAANYWIVPTGEIAARVTQTHTLESAAAHHLHVETEVDFDDVAVETGAGVAYGYAVMCPTRDVDRAVGFVNGVAGATQIVGTGDASTVLFGNAEKLVLWNSRHPRARLIVENLAGAGFSHTVDGVPVAIASQTFGINNGYGTKFYFPIYGSSEDADDLTGKVLGFEASYRVECADNVH